MCMKLACHVKVEETKTVYVLRLIDIYGNIYSPFRLKTTWQLGVKQIINTAYGIQKYSIGDNVEGSFFHSLPTYDLAMRFLTHYQNHYGYANSLSIYKAEIHNCYIGIGEISQDCIGAGLLCIVSPNLTLIEEVNSGDIYGIKGISSIASTNLTLFN